MVGAVIRSPGDLRWEPGTEGAEMAVVYGDAAAPDSHYVIRFRTDREIRVPLHWHKQDERITVLHGPFSLGFPDAGQYEEPKPVDEGSYVVVRAGVRHNGLYRADTLVQVDGTGPFETIYVDPVQG